MLKSIKMKLALSLSAIALTLLVSGVISVMEYSRMSNYVSGLMAGSVRSINIAQGLSETVNTYNLEILAVIGDLTRNELPDFDRNFFRSHCDSLRQVLAAMSLTPLADSVLYSYSAYMLTSLELPQILVSEEDSRNWFFERLQPRYQRLSRDLDAMSQAMYGDLMRNSETFDRGLYRSVIPGIVALGVGLLLILMLAFFLIAYYAGPIYKMLAHLKEYRTSGRKYSYTFDGDDQLSELNGDITEIITENVILKKRLSALKKAANESEDNK